MSELKRRTISGHSSDRKTGGLVTRTKKAKDLLADEEVTETSNAVNMKQSCKDKNMSFANFVIKSCKYDYPRMGHVPATYYRSVIADMQVRDKDGREILDVSYDIEDQYGRVYHILQSYPAGSRPFKQLAAALVAAGVPTGKTVNAGIGVCEIINLDYVSKKSDFGSIIERRPYVAPTVNDDQEDDDDDFLDEDDDLMDEDD